MTTFVTVTSLLLYGVGAVFTGAWIRDEPWIQAWKNGIPLDEVSSMVLCSIVWPITWIVWKTIELSNHLKAKQRRTP